jgi:hypothetical protein
VPTRTRPCHLCRHFFQVNDSPTARTLDLLGNPHRQLKLKASGHTTTLIHECHLPELKLQNPSATRNTPILPLTMPQLRRLTHIHHAGQQPSPAPIIRHTRLAMPTTVIQNIIFSIVTRFGPPNGSMRGVFTFI